ncbi:MAG: hypothetical protein ACK54C_09010, partial [Betaproteobacteria bacterium]
MSTVSLVVTAALGLSALGCAIWLGLALNRTSSLLKFSARIGHPKAGESVDVGRSKGTRNDSDARSRRDARKLVHHA